MESLKVRTGQICLQILDDQGNERGIFKFNPEDITVARNFANIQSEFEQKHAEFEERAQSCQNPKEELDLLYEVVEYMENLIDTCFGKGSSEILFGNAKSLSMFVDFFDGITPYYQKASEARMARYLKPDNK